MVFIDNVERKLSTVHAQSALRKEGKASSILDQPREQGMVSRKGSPPKDA